MSVKREQKCEQKREQKRNDDGKPRRLRRNMKIAVVITAVILIMGVTAGVAVSVVATERQKQRDDMLSSISDAAKNIGRGRYITARRDVFTAKELAERLRETSYADELEAYFRIIDAGETGNALFEAAQYREARNSFVLARDYAADIGIEDLSYINGRITSAESYIHVYVLLESADNLSERANYEEALSVYGKALMEATALSFTDGEIKANEGISGVTQSIEMKKRGDAESLLALGDDCFASGENKQAIDYYDASLDIYAELNDAENVELLASKIATVNNRIKEIELQEALAAAAAALAEAEAEAKARALAEAEAAAAEALATAQAADGAEAGDKVTGGSNTSDSNTGGSNTANSSTGDSNTNEAGTSDSDANYIYNLSIEFDLVTLINNQNDAPANLIRMGTTEGRNEGWYNGCGWVATYNALILLGAPQHPADIVRYLETHNGTVLGGVFGTYPNAIERYFKDLGYTVNHTVFPQRTINIDEAIKAAGTGILAYAHTSAAHYIAVSYCEADGKYIVYNDSSAARRSKELGHATGSEPGAVLDSVEDFINRSPEIMFSFSLITIAG